MITKNAASHTIIIRPTDDLDALCAEHYRQGMRPLLAEGYRFIIVDLEEMQYITSSGLGLLVELHNHVTRHEGSLRLINCNQRVNDLLKQTRLDTVFDTDSSSESGEIALQSLFPLLNQEVVFCSRINEVAERALKCDDPNKIAELILENLLSACGTDRGAFYLLDEDGRTLRLVAARSIDDDVLGPLKEFVLQPKLLETSVLEKNEITHYRTNGKKSETEPADLAERLGFQASVEIPVSGLDRPLGLLVLEEPDNDGRGLQLFQPLLRTFATICGLALAKSSLLTQCQSSNKELAASLSEVQKFQSTLVDGGKLAALGAVISGLGHLMNNKLVPIIGYTQLLSSKKGLDEKMLGQLESVNSAAVSLRGTMEKLIKISRVRDIAKQPVEVNDLIRKTLTLMGYYVEENKVTLRFDLAEDLPLVMGDHELLLQAVLAVIHRSCTSFQEDNEDRWISIVTRNCGCEVEIVIEDNGPGLGALDAESYLDPLVTFHELEQGQLFSFGIPRSVLKRHNGQLTLEEKEEGGVIIGMRIPVIDAAAPGQTLDRVPERRAQEIA